MFDEEIYLEVCKAYDIAEAPTQKGKPIVNGSELSMDQLIEMITNVSPYNK